MKKLALLFMLLTAMAQLAFGQVTTLWYSGLQKTVMTVPASGNVLNLTGSSIAYHKLVWTVSPTPLGACQVQVDSSADGIAWNVADVVPSTLCTTNGTVNSALFVANYVRVRTTALAGGTLTVVWTGYINNPVGGAVTNPTSGVVPINNAGVFIDSVIQPGATAPNGDVLAGNGTKFVDTVPGIDVSRTDATNSPATLDCSSTTGDRNRQVVLTFNGAITLPGTNWVPGAACDSSANAFIDVTGASAVVTFTPGGGTCNTTATCTMTQGFWRVRSTGTNTIVTVEPRTIIPPYPAAGTSVTMSASGYYKCSGACNVTFVPIPGNQYCVRNGDNVAAAITLVNVAGVQFEATAKTSYYAANRKLVSGAAITDQICYVVDSAGTHFDVWSSTGTWTDTAP